MPARVARALTLVAAVALTVATVTPALAATPPASDNLAHRQGTTWYLRGANPFHYGLAGDDPVMGDWNGDGTSTPGVYRDGTWYQRDANSGGPSRSFHFGLAGDRPVAGDWNGDGKDTVGVFRNGTWYLRDANASGPSRSFRFGLASDQPVVGDWNGDGRDTVGVFRNGTWYQRDANASGPSRSFRFGLSGDQAVAGDWDGNTSDTPGVNRGNQWFLRNANSSGPSTQVTFGAASGAVAMAWSKAKPRPRCSPAYPTVCIPPPPPDLDCREIRYRNFKVLAPDPHNFDGPDNDGIGCET
jgi:hypothetical protein